VTPSQSGDQQPALEMAFRPRTPAEQDKGYVSVVSTEEFNNMQQNGFQDEEEMDFTPQNGYHDAEVDIERVNSKGKKSGAPAVHLMGKIAAAGTAIKNARMPTPGEIKDGYLNSTFHKSLHQPLLVKSKVEKTDVQKARQAMTQEKTPLQLGNIESLTDIPIPSVRKSKQNQEENGEKSETKMPKNMDELGKTILPASFF